MPDTFSLSGGTTPQKRDSKWFRWMRILLYWQEQKGSSAAIAARRTDTLRGEVEKVLKTINEG